MKYDEMRLYETMLNLEKTYR